MTDEVKFNRQLDILAPKQMNMPVVIIGCGATGSFTALTLAKMGVKEITVYDFDVVEEHNLPNQFYRISDLGKPKVLALQEIIEQFEGIQITARNEKYKGQLSSLIAGINFVEKKNIDGILVCPVDHPLISKKLISELVEAFYSSKKKIILPTFNNQRGHPIIFSKELFEEIKNAPMDVGARAVVHSHSSDVCEMEWNDKNILSNIDTITDYKTLV